MNIFLFDLDGVVIHPGGYRAAFKSTVRRIARGLGFDSRSCAIDDETIEAFESCGITSEWDSTPICLAALVLEAWRTGQEVDLPSDFDWTLTGSLAPGRAVDPPDFRALARRVAQARRPDELAAEAALRLLLDDAATLTNADGRLPALERALAGLLAHSRVFPASPTLLVFQHYSLGSRAFEQTYGVPPRFDTPSCIQLHDRPGITPASKEAVLERVRSGRLSAAIYTLRPSRPPRELNERLVGYAPEAELALELVGLDELPLISQGRLSWLEALVGARPDAFAKPSPVHALAAVLAAVTRNEMDSLRAAHALAIDGRVTPAFDALRGGPLHLNVFEDAPGGVRGTLAAAEILTQTGLDVRVSAWGVTTSPEKARALESLGARVFPDLNAAIDVAADELPDLAG